MSFEKFKPQASDAHLRKSVNSALFPVLKYSDQTRWLFSGTSVWTCSSLRLVEKQGSGVVPAMSPQVPNNGPYVCGSKNPLRLSRLLMKDPKP